MALKRLFYNTIPANSRLIECLIAPENHNTYGIFALLFDDILKLFVSQTEALWHEI